MRKRMLSLILATIMVCTMMIPAVSAAEIPVAEAAQTTSRSSTRSDGSAAREDYIVPYNPDDSTIWVENRIHSLHDQGDMFVVGVRTIASAPISSAESVSVKVYAGTETLDYETFYSNYYTQTEFQAVLRDQDGTAANRATGTFILRFDETAYPSFSRRLEITFDYSNGR